MQTILDYTKEIIDEIRQYESEFTLTFTPDEIRIVDYYEDENWTIVRTLKYLNDFFIVVTDYGGHVDNINTSQFKTIKEAVRFIFK